MSQAVGCSDYPAPCNHEPACEKLAEDEQLITEQIDKRRRAYRHGVQHTLLDIREGMSRGLSWQEKDPRIPYVEVQIDKELYKRLFPEREVVMRGETPGDGEPVVDGPATDQ